MSMQDDWITAVRRWTDTGLSLVYPDCCQLCGAHPAQWASGYVCSDCRQQVGFIKPPLCEVCGLPYEGDITTSFECSNCREMELHFHWARSSVVARGPVLEAIHRYKYQRQLWFENFLGELLVQGALPVLQAHHWDVIVPVPLHFLKEREREFNQAERLAQRLSAATGIPVATRLLKRIEPTRTQTLLSRVERAQNVRRAFALRSEVSLRDQCCLLVDDVFTTGATTSACARLLRKAGAELVAVWTVARGL